VRTLYIRTSLCLAIATTLLPPVARAQGAVVVLTQIEARQRLQSAPPPVYPMLAQAARVFGVVNVDVTIAPDGQVVQARSLGGPPMLEASAVVGVKAWRFQPLATPAGEPFTGRAVISVFYGVSPSQAATEALVAYSDALMRCAAGIEFGEFAGALPYCDTARTREPDLDAVFMQAPRAMLLQGLALVGLGRHEESLKLLTAALKANPALQADRALAELGLARTHRALNDLRAAVDRYEDAYDRFRDLYRRSSPDFSLGDYCAEQMRRMTPEYVALLEQLGRQRDADRVKSRTDSLRSDERRPFVPPPPPPPPR
jgi:TonB family protein